jgi:hypothetical protein
MTQDKKTEAREWWIHADEYKNLDEKDWFIPVVIADNNMWDRGQNIHVIEYSALQQLREENEALRKALEFYASVESWNGSTYQYRARIDSTDESKVQGFDQHINFGGKRAREVLAKYPKS